MVTFCMFLLVAHQKVQGSLMVNDIASQVVTSNLPSTEQNAYAQLTVGSAYGGVAFEWDALRNCMRIEGVINNLTPGFHGFHIHESGNLRSGCLTTANHYNPFDVSHAGPDHPTQHVGDLGNIYANHNGVSTVNKCVSFVHTVGEYSVIGRSVVVHAYTDDLGLRGDEESKRTGNAGARLACGVIGLANNE